jgi:hypothetical protein
MGEARNQLWTYLSVEWTVELMVISLTRVTRTPGAESLPGVGAADLTVILARTRWCDRAESHIEGLQSMSDISMNHAKEVGYRLGLSRLSSTCIRFGRGGSKQ